MMSAPWPTGWLDAGGRSARTVTRGPDPSMRPSGRPRHSWWVAATCLASLGPIAACTQPARCVGTGPYSESTTIAVEQQDFWAVVDDPEAITETNCDQLCPIAYRSGCEIVSVVPGSGPADTAGEEGEPVLLRCIHEGVIACF